jgi:quercetin dioxygenase-like cupin family protein
MIDVIVRNLDQEIRERQGFQLDTEEVLAEVHFKTVQHYLDAHMNVVIMTGGRNGLQLPHYHKHGFDFFVVLQGRGWLHTADLEDGQITAAGWRHQRLERGDSYGIEPNQAHCLLNDESEDLVFLNISPAAHMSTDYFVLNDVDLSILRGM